MTQLLLSASLTDRIRAWAGEPRSFADLADAFPEVNATDLDVAATEAGVLHWGANGLYVAREVTP